MIISGPTMARASASGRSSCPRCTPSAPHSRATSGRSLMKSSAPVQIFLASRAMATNSPVRNPEA